MKKLEIRCPRCEKRLTFEQGQLYNSRHTDQGFMYSHSGRYALIWSWSDPVISTHFPEYKKWLMNEEFCEQFEKALTPAPDGTRWGFANPLRCLHCKGQIAGAFIEQSDYFIPLGSVVTDRGNKLNLQSCLLTSGIRSKKG